MCVRADSMRRRALGNRFLIDGNYEIRENVECKHSRIYYSDI